MQAPSYAAPTPQTDAVRTRPVMADAVYRMVTVGAILLVLGSLWAF